MLSFDFAQPGYGFHFLRGKGACYLKQDFFCFVDKVKKIRKQFKILQFTKVCLQTFLQTNIFYKHVKNLENKPLS